MKKQYIVFIFFFVIAAGFTAYTVFNESHDSSRTPASSGCSNGVTENQIDEIYLNHEKPEADYVLVWGTTKMTRDARNTSGELGYTGLESTGPCTSKKKPILQIKPRKRLKIDKHVFKLNRLPEGCALTIGDMERDMHTFTACLCDRHGCNDEIRQFPPQVD